MATVNIVKVPGDYQLLAQAGGIVLDVGGTTSTLRTVNAGTVTIYGNLDVVGNTTTVESTNTNISDNLLFLNAGEVNNYVTKGTAGIAIARGVTDTNNTFTNAATLIFNDGDYWRTDDVVNNRGVWRLGVGAYPSALKLAALRVDSNLGGLNLFGKDNPGAVLNVDGTLDYEVQVEAWGDDAIPNKKYVDQKAYAGEEFTKKIKVGNSFIEINDNSILPTDKYYRNPNRIFGALGTSTNIVFQFEGTTALVQGIRVNDTNIAVVGGRSSNDISITPFSTGTVKIESALGLSKVPAYNTTSTAYTFVYSTSTVGGGGTGVYYVNNTQRDEFVSRKRAIIYGIIF